MSRSSVGAPLPATTNQRWYKVVSPKGGTPLVVNLLSDVWYGVWVHWDGRPVPCEGTPECRNCKRKLPNRWAGYIACFNFNAQERAVAALTEGAANQFASLLELRGSLRGVTAELRRLDGSKPNSPVMVKVLREENPHEIMDEHPIMDSLNRLWGINQGYVEQHRQGSQDMGTARPARSVALPQPRPVKTEERATAEQWRRLQQTLGGMGAMPE